MFSHRPSAISGVRQKNGRKKNTTWESSGFPTRLRLWCPRSDDSPVVTSNHRIPHEQAWFGDAIQSYVKRCRKEGCHKSQDIRVEPTRHEASPVQQLWRETNVGVKVAAAGRAPPTSNHEGEARLGDRAAAETGRQRQQSDGRETRREEQQHPKAIMRDETSLEDKPATAGWSIQCSKHEGRQNWKTSQQRRPAMLIQDITPTQKQAREPSNQKGRQDQGTAQPSGREAWLGDKGAAAGKLQLGGRLTKAGRLGKFEGYITDSLRNMGP